MDEWRLFSDPRFALAFRYPDPTPDGKSIAVRESKPGGAVRVHLISVGSEEVYFEVTRYDGQTAESLYARLGNDLPVQIPAVQISPAEPVTLAGAPALAGSFSWPGNRRDFFMIDIGDSAYRIVFNLCHSVRLSREPSVSSAQAIFQEPDG
jgi:hypothetical protein